MGELAGEGGADFVTGLALGLGMGELELVEEGNASFWAGLALGLAMGELKRVGEGEDEGVSAELALGLGAGSPMRSALRVASRGERRGVAIKKLAPAANKTPRRSQSLTGCFWFDPDVMIVGAEFPDDWEC